jgi:hypothetical protein
MRRSTTWLAGLILATSSSAALATTPNYDYLQLDYVYIDPDDPENPGAPDINSQGAHFELSALIAPYLFFNASYEWTESDDYQQGLVDGRVANQFVTGGLGGRFPFVRNMLDGTLGADFIYADSKNKGDFEDVYDDEYDTGFQVKASLRANFRWVEVIPTVRYVDIFDDNDIAYGLQVLGCPGYGICAIAGAERFQDAETNRYFAGVRFYYN